MRCERRITDIFYAFAFLPRVSKPIFALLEMPEPLFNCLLRKEFCPSPHTSKCGALADCVKLLARDENENLDLIPSRRRPRLLPNARA